MFFCLTICKLGNDGGVHINFSKCELFSRNGNSHFPQSSLLPNLDILGVPLGILCTVLASLQRYVQPPKPCLKLLWTSLQLTRMCGSYYKLVHLARATPPSHCADYLKLFDEEVRLCFTSCIAVDVPDPSWQQAQLSSKSGWAWLLLACSALFCCFHSLLCFIRIL